MTGYLIMAFLNLKTGGRETFGEKDYELRFGHTEADMPTEHLSGSV